MSVRSSVVRFHRWLGIVAAVFWLVQAATGIFAVFHWEIDDATVAGPRRPTNFERIQQNVPRWGSVGSIWTSAGAADRYDVFLSDRVLRIDGEGNVLRARRDSELFADGGLANTIIEIHHELLGGDTGKTIVGISGILLFTNLLAGIVVAWPRRGQWRRAVVPWPASTPIARLYSWHRALGLWVSIPALLLVSAGVMMAFEETTEKWLGAAPVEAPPHPPSLSAGVGMVDAIRIAQSRYPQSVVSGIGFPSEEQAAWKITLKQQGERRRAYGKTRVFVSANDGSILADFDALRASGGRTMADNLFALHTGEIGGTPGRIFVLLFGLWLITMIVLGLNLWLKKLRPPSASSAPLP